MGIVVGIGNLRNHSWLVQRLGSKSFASVERHGNDLKPLQIDGMSEEIIRNKLK